MFKHILVPLDGSELAESALPAAAYLARICGSEVTLLHVIEGHAPSEIHGERHLKEPVEAEGYLRSAGSRFFAPTDSVSYHVHASPVTGVAAGITDHQDEFDHDLIIMCTHGRSGTSELVFGSIAQKIASLGTVPVLIVRPALHGSLPFAATPMLVPIDTTGLHEASLSVAEHLAAQIGGEIQLVMVVPTLSTIPGQWEDATKLLPHSTDRLLEMAAEEAASLLEEKRASIAGHGITVRAELDRGDPAKVIAERAEGGGARLVVLGTHGKSGMEALWEGSVASRAISRVTLPVLLVPVAR